MRFIGRLQLLVSAERSTVRCGPRDLVAADHPLVRSQTAPSKSAMGSTGFSWGVRREHGWSFAWACLILSSARPFCLYLARSDSTAPTLLNSRVATTSVSNKFQHVDFCRSLGSDQQATSRRASTSELSATICETKSLTCL
jgi:hypothetical protein